MGRRRRMKGFLLQVAPGQILFQAKGGVAAWLPWAAVRWPEGEAVRPDREKEVGISLPAGLAREKFGEKKRITADERR